MHQVVGLGGGGEALQDLLEHVIVAHHFDVMVAILDESLALALGIELRVKLRAVDRLIAYAKGLIGL